MKTSQKLGVAGLILAGTLALAGCGDKDTPAMSPSPTGMMTSDSMMSPSPSPTGMMSSDSNG